MPIIINLQERYTTVMNTNVTVYSPYDLLAYVTGRSLIPGATYSTINVTTTLSYPYQIMSFDTNLAVSGPMSPQVTAQMVQVRFHGKKPSRRGRGLAWPPCMMFVPAHHLAIGTWLAGVHAFPHTNDRYSESSFC